MTENIQFQNIEIHAQDSSIHHHQHVFQKEENQELQDQEFIQELNKVWLKTEYISFQDLKIVNVELSDKHNEIHGELKKEVEIQVLDIIEFLLTLVIMNRVKSKKDMLELQLEAKDLEEAL